MALKKSPPKSSNPKPRPKQAVKPAVKIKTVYKHELTVVQLDNLGLRLASLPISNKDRELVAKELIDVLGISDTARFFDRIRATEVPTPKT